MLFRKCRFFSVAHGFQLDNGVPSPGQDIIGEGQQLREGAYAIPNNKQVDKNAGPGDGEEMIPDSDGVGTE